MLPDVYDFYPRIGDLGLLERPSDLALLADARYHRLLDVSSVKATQSEPYYFAHKTMPTRTNTFAPSTLNAAIFFYAISFILTILLMVKFFNYAIILRGMCIISPVVKINRELNY